MARTPPRPGPVASWLRSWPRSWRMLVAFLAVLLATFAAAPAAAHPHGWIDIEVEVLFDADGRATGLWQTWLFDEGYSAFVTEGTMTDPDGRPLQELLDELLAENMTNLQAYDYFTQVKQDGNRIRFGPVTEMSTRMIGDRLETRFLLPFATPVSPRESELTYSVYDPTYFIEMLHAEIEDPVRLAGAPPACGHRLIAPRPTAEQVARAAMLDITQSSDDGLGILFAETVRITCDG